MVTEFQDKSCYDFQKLIDHAIAEERTHETWIPKLDDVTLNTDFDRISNGWSYDLIWHGGSRVKNSIFSPFAFNQYCRRMKCPAKFMLTLPGNLAKGNLDFFKEDQRDQEISIKVAYREDINHPDGGFYYTRGIVSPSAALISNSQFLQDLKPTVEEHGMRVWKSHFRPHDFHAKMIFGKDINVGTIQNPDNVNIGVHISNSDVGARPLQVDMMLFRLVCTNGMIDMVDGVPLFRMRQVNVSRSEFRDRLQNALHTLGNRKDMLIGKFQDARNETVAKPYIVLSRICKKHALSKGQANAVKEEYNRGLATGEYDFNRISLVNAITRYAQECEQETRLKLETVAGKFLFDDEILEHAVDKVEKDEVLVNDGL
jgi:hypothetical protein